MLYLGSWQHIGMTLLSDKACSILSRKDQDLILDSIANSTNIIKSNAKSEKTKRNTLSMEKFMLFVGIPNQACHRKDTLDLVSMIDKKKRRKLPILKSRMRMKKSRRQMRRTA